MMSTFAPYPFDFDSPQGTRIDLDSFDDFVSKVANPHSNYHGIAWRGLPDANWRLTSGAFRAERTRIQVYGSVTGETDRDAHIQSIAHAVEERMAYASRAVQKAIGTDPHLRLLFQDALIDREIHKDPVMYGELLAICQHYGMKTPLIDVTDSAFVALYFAAWFAMQESRDWRSKNHLAVWKIPTNFWNEGLSYVMIPDKEPAALAKKQHAFEQDPSKPVNNGSMKVSISNVFPRVYRNDRLVAQQGSFVRVTPDLPLDHVLAMMHVRSDSVVFEPMLGWLTQYTLPATLALDCLVHLTKMNIRPDTLFPDLPGQMDRIDLAADHYDYSGMGDRLRGSLFDATGIRRPHFNV